MGVGGGRRWRWWVVALVGLAGTIIAGASLAPMLIRLGAAFFQQPLNEQSARADVASMLLAAAGLGISGAALVVAVLQLRQASRSSRSVTPQVHREQQALDRLAAHLGRQVSLPRMGDPTTQALSLRVHPAIDLPQSTLSAEPPNGVVPPLVAGWRRLLRPWSRRPRQRSHLDRNLPVFVNREQGPELRRWLEATRNTSGFLVLVGDSSVGKTRLLYEGARQVLPDFVVLAPDFGDGELVNQLAAATFPLPRLLVWLDELQRFLDGPYLTPESTSITAATVRRLLAAPTPVVILGTLWPEYASQLRASDPDPATDHSRPRYPNAVDILDDRRVRELVLRTFSDAERRAAARLAVADPRLATALADRDYNVTEALAGAPELVRRYERATNEQQAVVHAAVDARRLGIQAPLGERLLRAAARGYLTGIYADDTWFGPVLSELTSDYRPQDRATAPLIPVPGPDRSGAVGYTVADYLLQRLANQRRAVRVPATAWQAFIDHTNDQDDLARLAASASNRLLYCYATPLYQRLAEVDHWPAIMWLTDMLAEHGRIDELKIRAEAGNWFAAARLAELLVERAQIEELQARADTGDRFAGMRLAQLLAEQDRTDELWSRADAGDEHAAKRLAELLDEQGRIDEFIELLRTRVDGDLWFAADRLAELLVEQGRIDELRDRADAGDESAASRLANLLVEQGRIDELRDRADAGDESAALWLANLLAEESRIDEAIELLRAHADHWFTADRLAGLLAQQGRIDELRDRADAGDESAASRLAELLAELGRIDELRARVEAGDWMAAIQLAEVQVEEGHIDKAIELLRARADADHWPAIERLADLLAHEGHIDEAIDLLREQADAGDESAISRLIELLAEQDRIDDLVELLAALADTGDESAASRLAWLLALHGRINELRGRADAGDWPAADQLAGMLAEEGRIDEAIDLLRGRADAGDETAASRLAELLAEQDRIDELRTEVAAGTPTAGSQLLGLLTKRGQTEQVKQLRRWGLDPNGSFAAPESAEEANG